MKCPHCGERFDARRGRCPACNAPAPQQPVQLAPPTRKAPPAPPNWPARIYAAAALAACLLCGRWAIHAGESDFGVLARLGLGAIVLGPIFALWALILLVRGRMRVGAAAAVTLGMLPLVAAGALALIMLAGLFAALRQGWVPLP